ncbi:MAG: DUF4406 domain-containing protein [Gammaproteobacteria bacterium]|nr:DUF4406 domain-containing protein [Gammaproteobacteria bacterium]
MTVKPFTLYLSGPMTRLADYNHPMFHRVAELLRDAGFTVINPAENPAPADPTWENWMRIAIVQVVQADGLAMLDGWRDSRGARLEERVASSLSMPCRHWAKWLFINERVVAA